MSKFWVNRWKRASRVPGSCYSITPPGFTEHSMYYLCDSIDLGVMLRSPCSNLTAKINAGQAMTCHLFINMLTFSSVFLDTTVLLEWVLEGSQHSWVKTVIGCSYAAITFIRNLKRVTSVISISVSLFALHHISARGTRPLVNIYISDGHSRRQWQFREGHIFYNSCI